MVFICAKMIAQERHVTVGKSAITGILPDRNGVHLTDTAASVKLSATAR